MSGGVSLSVISILAALCFHSSLKAGFVFDDVEAVVNNDDVKMSTPIWNVFGNDFWGTHITHNASHKSYRPITVLSFRLNVWAAGGELNASHFHCFNIVLYVILCCLSLFVLRAICGKICSSKVSSIAAVLFTIHPVHTEAVAPAVGRADLLCANFMFFAFLIYDCGLKNKNSTYLFSICTTLTTACTALAMFAKEQGITILMICSAYDLLIHEQIHPTMLLNLQEWRNYKIKKILTRQVILVTAMTLLFFMRWWIMGGTVPVFQKVDNPASFMDSIHFRVVNYIYIYSLNVWLMMCPEWLCYDWSMGCVPLIHSASDLRIAIVAVFITTIGLLTLTILRNTNREARQLLMAVTLIVLPFLPASNIFFRVGFVVAERTLLVPSLGFCLLVALGVPQLVRLKISPNVTHVLLGLLLVTFSVRCHMRTNQWMSERSLFESALSVCPLNAKVHYNLAKTCSNQTEAENYYRQALRLNPTYDQAMNNLANILKDLGELSEAEKLLRHALQLRPDFAAAWMNLGIVLANKKQLKEAEQSYQNAIKYRRKYPDCYYNLGNLYLEQKNHEKAYDSWRKATALDPSHHAAWNNLIIMLDSIGKHVEASSLGKEALSALPNSSAIHFNIANSLGKISDFQQAEFHFKAAIKLNPNYPLYYVNLGVLYHHWMKFGLAREMYQHALLLDPNLKSAKENLHLLPD